MPGQRHGRELARRAPANPLEEANPCAAPGLNLLTLAPPGSLRGVFLYIFGGGYPRSTVHCAGDWTGGNSTHRGPNLDKNRCRRLMHVHMKQTSSAEGAVSTS
jgi:hypothetical protein